MRSTVFTQPLKKRFTVHLVVPPTSITHQFFRPHIVQDALRVLTVVTALHDGQKQLGGIILLNRDQVSEFCVHHCKPSSPLWKGGMRHKLHMRVRDNCIHSIVTEKITYSFAWNDLLLVFVCVCRCIHTFSSSTRSILFLPRGLMSFKMSAMMMSMPLHSWVAMQFWKTQQEIGIGQVCYLFLLRHKFP